MQIPPLPLRLLASVRAAASTPLVAGLLLSGCGGSSGPPVELGVSAELAAHRAATLSELHYDIALEIPRDRKAAITGRTVVEFEWDDPSGAPVVLDFKDPEERVEAVTVNGEDARWRPVEDHLVLPSRYLDAGANRVEVVFTAGDEALNRSEDFLYTLFVPDRAHFSLPVFDQPDLKARVAWSLTVPADWVAVANGPARNATGFPSDLVGTGVARELVDPDIPVGEAAAGRTRTLEFSASRPIPTYLMAFAAGRFQVEMARVGRYYFTMLHRETDPEVVARNRRDIFELHRTALDWLDEYTDIGYPFQKFDFVLLPPFQYGGMEHPGSIFYRQSSLMLDASATQSDLLGRASLIAHETAHMWFGNLVTMAWFDDVWTKEVFANFMAARIVEPSFPEVDHRLRFLTAHHPRAYGVDRTPGANPIRQPLENLREAGTLYGAIIYQKAPVVMAHLERTVGAETFREGMRRYLDTYAFGNATWPDLIRILDELTEEDLAAWSRVWVDEPGRPTVRVERIAGGGVGLAQEDRWGRGRVWPQRLTLVGSWSGALADTVVELAGAGATAWAGRPAPDWVLPTGAGIEYGLFRLDADARTALMAATPGLGDPVLRAAAWIVTRDALLEGELDPEALLDAVLAALEREENEIVVGQLLGLLDDLYWRLVEDQVRVDRAPSVEATLWQQVMEAPSETLAATYFRAWRGVAVTPDGVARMRRIWSGQEGVPGVTLSERDRTRLAQALALRGVEDAPGILDRQAQAIDNPDRRAEFDFVRPALSADAAVREDFFTSLAQVENRAREPWVLKGLGFLQHPLRREHGATLVPAGLELVEELQRTGDIFFPRRWLGVLLGSHHDPAVSAAVHDFLAARPDYPPRLRGKVLQAWDGVRRAARIVHGPDAAPAWAPPDALLAGSETAG